MVIKKTLIPYLNIQLACVALIYSLLSIKITADELQQSYSYAVVLSQAAYGETGWKAVADSLVKKHSQTGTAKLFIWPESVNDVKSELSAFMPNYIGYIARPASECNTEFVVTVSRLSRNLDSDPYGDAVWGIITGFEAGDALRAVSQSLEVKTVLLASNNLSYEPPIQRFYQGIGMTCDSYTKTDYLFPDKSGEVYTENKRPDAEQDRIKLVCKYLNAQDINITVQGQGTIQGPVDCIITGGHGNVNVWQCHYPEVGTEGYMNSSNGSLFGSPNSGSTISIKATTPKVYWCATNCLMGNPNDINNIVYAAFHSGQAVQMFGFMNEASAGDDFMAWGVYDRTTKFAGKYTLAESFFLSNNIAQFELKHPGGEFVSAQVKLFMDSTVFYGDPAADVTFHDFGDSAKSYKESLTFSENAQGNTDFTYTVTPVAHDIEFGKGYCYVFRPAILLPVRIDPTTVAITKNSGHTTEILENQVIWEMLSKGEVLRKGQSKSLQWTALVTDKKTAVIQTREQHLQNIKAKTEILVLSGITGLMAQIRNIPAGAMTLQMVSPAGRVLYTKSFISDGLKQYTLKLPIGSVSGVCIISLYGRGGCVQKRAFVKT
jgi:hypothetical protein